MKGSPVILLKKLSIMKNFIITILSLFIFIPISNAQYLWGKQATGDAQTNGYDVAIDHQNNVFVVGNMDKTITFEDVTVGDVDGNSFEHNYIAKYNSSGDLLWVKTIKGNSNNELWAVAVDGQGNAYVSGTYSHTNSFTILDFGNIQLDGNNSSSGFLAKIDADGEWQWARALLSEDLLGQQSVKPVVIKVMPNGKILLSGYMKGPAIVNGQTYNPVNDALQKIFFSSFNEEGDFEWFKHGEGAWGISNATPYLELQLDAAGNSYMLCSFGDGASYESDTLTHPFGGGFGVMSFDSDANLRWWKNISSSAAETLGGLTLDNEDNVYISARKGAILFIGDDIVIDDLLFNLWIIKFDSNGNYIYAKGVFDSGNTVNSAWTHDISYHPDGSILLTGGYEPLFGLPILFGDTLGGGGYKNAFIAAYSTSGNYKGSVELSYPDNAMNGEFLPKDMVVDMDGNLVVIGEFDYEIEIGGILFSSDLLNQMFAIKIDIANLIDLSTPTFEVPKNQAPSFSIYPNPTADYVFIENESGTGTLRIINNAGILIQTIAIKENTQFVDLSNLAAGTYYLSLGNTVQKMVVVR